MAQGEQISAWIALFTGLYALAAGMGELRSPNTWWMMLKEFERNPALRFVAGFLALAFGATVYLVNPWRPGDWLAVAVSAIGGLHVAQGLLILASGERFLQIARMVIGRASRGWAGFAMLFGVGAVLAGLARLEAF